MFLLFNSPQGLFGGLTDIFIKPITGKSSSTKDLLITACKSCGEDI